MDSFISSLHQWYRINKRDLPWRNTQDPYQIWISEIILQQTRIAQGTNYYLRFIHTFPTIVHLAEANEDEVLKLWQGLGYYSRARNLHSTAKTIVHSHGAKFPTNYTDLLKLKGIGPYTAAAIASMAFDLPYPAVDGNIYRVLSRYFGIATPIDSSGGKKQFQQLAEELIINKPPGMHNQALMEFGALQCVPKSPDCSLCPVADTCFAKLNQLIEQLPVKSKKTKQSKRYFYYYLIDDGTHIYINKRTSNDIWKNLHELPLLESPHEISDEEIIQKKVPYINGTNFNIKLVSSPKKHILSHQVIHSKLIYIEVNTDVDISKPLIRVNKKDISKFAVPRLVEQFFETFNLV
ncbi:A/G-specific adenine glycosylase [Prolixibacteraceae bacterium Z1-6]|uniref:Adenine DNA glycosylase n=1 Tax=Draconibacterium aestuarii TaxID=2998507 RepID=A0A9X3FG32_9BACT|nr:A/G-specific adenine glycosylase [Prolixibacteraceae bacterium Z1-6]